MSGHEVRSEYFILDQINIHKQRIQNKQKRDLTRSLFW